MTTAKTSNNNFEDPAENYDPPIYDDPLQQALADERVTAIQSQPCTSVSPDTLVADAIHKLVGREIACVLVEEAGRLVGLFSDRDILDKVALEYDDVKDLPVNDVMTPDPVYVYDTDSASAALCVMAVNGYRHVPVVDLDRRVMGIISPQRIAKFLREHFNNG